MHGGRADGGGYFTVLVARYPPCDQSAEQSGKDRPDDRPDDGTGKDADELKSVAPLMPAALVFLLLQFQFFPLQISKRLADPVHAEFS